jgi:hypothetical protein
MKKTGIKKPRDEKSLRDGRRMIRQESEAVLLRRAGSGFAINNRSHVVLF